MSNEVIKDIGFGVHASSNQDTSLVQVEQSRAIAETQAKYIIARKFPRNQMEAYARIIETCKRPNLAEQAMYAYPRGGKTVTGPSIRLAEALAQNWGHIDFGFKELSQSNGVSIAEAYAIDLCTNTHSTKIFHVPHIRDTKNGSKRLTDGRDIYELVANQAARRMRACILAILPGDVVEAAVERCKKTLESSDIPLQEQVKKMVLAFDEFGVKVEHLEKRLGHNMEAIIPAEIVQLKSVYKSLKDETADRSDFFDIGAERLQNADAELDSLLEHKKPMKVNVKTGEVLKDEKK